MSPTGPAPTMATWRFDVIRRIVQLLPERQFWKLFLKSQDRRREYLQSGDRINATIRSPDERFDLGEQIIRVA